MTCDPATLVNDARCISCIPPDKLSAVAAYLLCEIANNPPVIGPHDLLSLTHPDTLPGPPVKGSIPVGNSTPLWEAFPVGLVDGQSLLVDSTAPFGIKWGTPAGGGTVTDFSAGDLSPLFTTSVATSTTTPALSFSLSTQVKNTVFAGPASGANAAPTFRALVVDDFTGLGLTDGQLIIGSTGVAPVAASLTAGSNISITPGPGAITIATTGLVGTHTVLDATVHTDTVTAAVVQGDLIFGNATPKWDRLPKNTTATRYLSNTGASNAPAWAQVNLANGVTGQLPLANGGTNNNITADPGAVIYSTAVALALTLPGAAGQLLQSNGVGAPDWTSATYPSGAGSVGQILRSDGTNWQISTATYPNTAAINSILYASAANTISALAPANSSVLGSTVAGVPTWIGPMTNGQLIIGSTGATPVAASLTAGANIAITPGAGSITIAATGLVGTHTVLDATVHTDTVTQSVSRGSLIYGNATPKWDELVIGASARLLRSDGTDVSWAQAVLATDVTGILPVANGGTALSAIADASILVTNAANVLTVLTAGSLQSVRRNLANNAWEAFTPSTTTGTVTSVSWTGGIVSIANPTTTPAFTIAGTSGGIPFFSSGTTWASSALLAASQLVLGGGAGAAPATLGSLGTTTTVLHGNAAGAPTFGAVSLTADVSGILPLLNGGTNKATVAVNGAVVWCDADSFELTAAGSAGQILRSAGAASPTWSTATYPATATTAGAYLRADGTNWIMSTLTLPNASVQGDIFYSTAANAIIALAKNTTATRYLSNTGTNNDPAWAQVNLTNGVTGVLPVGNGGSGTSTTFTQGSVIFAGASGVFSQSNADFFWDNTNKRLCIGTTSSVSPLTLSRSFGSAGANQSLADVRMTALPTANEATFVYTAAVNVATKDGAFNLTTVNGLRGLQNVVLNLGSGGLTEAAALTVSVLNLGTGTIANAFGVLMDISAAAGSPITNLYALKIPALKITGVTNGFPIYSEGASDFSYFAGTMGIGTNVLGSRLQVLANPNDFAPYSLTSWNGTGQAVTAFLKAPTANGGVTPNAAEPALILARNGTTAVTYPTIVEFKIRRWETGNAPRASTALDIAMTDVGNQAAGGDILSILSNGCTGFGTLQPNARIHIAAGTATARTGPLQFTTGASLSVAVAGSMEFTTDDLFFTITTGAARKRLLMADSVGGLTVTRVPFATTNGRLADSGVFTFNSGTGVLSVTSISLDTGVVANDFEAGSLDIGSGNLQIGTDGKVATYQGIGTEGWGIPSIVDDITLTGQVANIASTNFTNAGTAGKYRLVYYLVCTTAAVGAGTITFTVTYTQGGVARTLTSQGVLLTSTANKSNIWTNTDIDGSLIQLDSGSVAYSVAIVGIYSTAQYALYASLQRLA